MKPVNLAALLGEQDRDLRAAAQRQLDAERARKILAHLQGTKP